MFPFEIQFSKTINRIIDRDEINRTFHVYENLLNAKGADRIFIENNRLIFKNDFLKLISNWNLMAFIDSGFVELKKTAGNSLKITYGVRTLKMWIISLIFGLIVLFSTNELKTSIIAFCFLGVLTWIITVLRHWKLLYTITKEVDVV